MALRSWSCSDRQGFGVGLFPFPFPFPLPLLPGGQVTAGAALAAGSGQSLRGGGGLHSSVGAKMPPHVRPYG